MVKSASLGRTTRIRGAGAASPALPEELVVWEILVRLPATALLRCRAVCRRWLLLTSADDFLLAHHRRQPSLPLVIFRDSISLVGAAVDALDLRRPPAAERRPVLRFNDDCNHRRRRRHFEVHASCDGLLLLSLSGGGRFYLCNPATRQWITLPSLALAGSTVAGLYPHGSSGEYRVLYRRSRHHGGGVVDDVYYVLTVGSSAEPRRITRPVTSPSSSSSIEQSLVHISQRPPVLIRGCLHWGQQLLKPELIAFDTVAESFRCISAPAAYTWAWGDLFDMDGGGTLGVSIVSEGETTVELWALQDYETEVWSLKYRIGFPAAEMRTVAKNSSFDVLVVSGDGDMLAYCDTDSHLFYCGSSGRLLQKLQWDRVFPKVTGHWFRESLFRHSFFKNRNHGFMRQPRFFRGL